MKFAYSIALAGLMVLAAAASAAADNGLIVKPSAHSAAETLDRLEAALKEHGFVVFARLDHSAAAAKVGIKMPASTVVVFGNPRAGSPAMLKQPSLAIDLPLKALVWEGADGKVSITYNSAEYVQGTIFPRHGLPTNAGQQKKIESALGAITDAAVK